MSGRADVAYPAQMVDRPLARLDIYARRLEAGLTLQQLATRAGLHLSTVGRIERGWRERPRPDTLRRLEQALGAAEKHSPIPWYSRLDDTPGQINEARSSR